MSAPSKPASLGDPATSFKRIKEEYPLPTSRKDLLTAVEALVNAGGVQKMVIELGKPIIVHRYVDASKVAEIPEVPMEDEDPYLEIRNGVLVDFRPAPVGKVLPALFFAFRHLYKLQAAPKFIACHTQQAFAEMLGSKEEISDAFGVPVLASKNIPEATIILAGTLPDDTLHSLRLEVHLPKK